jgi:hypothetical protein
MKPSVYDKLRKAEQSSAWDRVAAYVILKDTEYVGKILCKYPKDCIGPLEVFLWDWVSLREIQYGRATGCGYDKLAAALDGLKFGDLTLSDHPNDWKHMLEEAGYTLIQAI